jgi:hypothetical protein
VLKATLERVRCDEHVQQTLGAKEAAEVKLKRSSWLFGDAGVGGAVSSLQRRDDDDDARDAQGGWEGGGFASGGGGTGGTALGGAEEQRHSQRRGAWPSPIEAVE